MLEGPMIQIALPFLIALFPVSEIALAIVKRSRGEGTQSEDRGSLRLLWIGITVGVVLAIFAQRVRPAHLPGPHLAYFVLSLTFLLGGLALRWAAILTLGRLFTVDVAIHENHEVVQSGLYRLVRHPSYTGLLVAFVGVGFYFVNWLSMVVLLVPIVLVVFNRVVQEERALVAALGADYESYCARTKRFIPGVL
jgi:protein-S-isoprenylcysteine O-methyltransferase